MCSTLFTVTVLNAKEIRYGDAHRGRNSRKGRWLAGETQLIPCCVRRSSVRGYGYRTEYKHYRSQKQLRVRGCCKSQEKHCKAPICPRATILYICTSLHRTASSIFHSLFQPRMIPHPSIPSHIFILYSLERISAKGNLHLIHSFSLFAQENYWSWRGIPVLSCLVSSLSLFDSCHVQPR